VQAEKLADAANRYTLATLPEPRASGKGGFDGTVSPSATRLAAAADAFNKELAEILTPEQMRRLDQIALQRVAAGTGMRAALARPAVATRLDLSAEQTRKIGAADDAARRMARLVESSQVGPDTDYELRTWLQERLEAEIMALLTAEQKAAWREQAGQPDPAIKKAGLTGPGRPGPVGG
jgi:hypothetical protein